jgi:hypothetical protein
LDTSSTFDGNILVGLEWTARSFDTASLNAASAQEYISKLSQSRGLASATDKPEVVRRRRSGGESFRHQCKSSYCAGKPPHEHDRLDEPEFLHPRRGGESSHWENKSSYPDSDYDLFAYRAETAVFLHTLSSARPSSSSCKSSYCAGESHREHDRLDEPETPHSHLYKTPAPGPRLVEQTAMPCAQPRQPEEAVR